MNAASRCGAAIGDAQAYIHLTPTAGVCFALALLVIGYLISEGLHRWLEEGDEQIAAALSAAQDESLSMATSVMAPYPGGIPAQRVGDGEDLLRPITSGPKCEQPTYDGPCSLFGGHPGPCFPGGAR